MKKSKFLKIAVAIVAVAALVCATFGVNIFVEKQWIYPVKYSDLVSKYSQMYSVEEAWIYAVINCESGFESDAVSSAGAIGLMQITPETFTWLQNWDDTEENLSADMLYDAEINIKYGTLLLSLNFQEFGNMQTTIASYNAGRGKVSEWLADERYSNDSRTLTRIPYGETEKYVENVVKNYHYYSRRLKEK